MDLDFIYYSKAIWVLEKAKIDINKYNDKNIILLENYNDELNIEYSKKDYIKLIDYLENSASEGYIRLYWDRIIKILKDKYTNELYDMLIIWVNKYSLEEYQINLFLNMIYEKIDYIDKMKLKEIGVFKKYKVCQDLLIILNVESEIINRINYIKENLVYSGDLYSIEKNGDFEYSSG